MTPNTIEFKTTSNTVRDGWVMRITAEGRIEVAEGADVTETARQVLDALQYLLRAQLTKLIADEREACAKLADEYADGPERNYSEIIADAIRARGQA